MNIVKNLGVLVWIRELVENFETQIGEKRENYEPQIRAKFSIKNPAVSALVQEMIWSWLDWRRSISFRSSFLEPMQILKFL